MRNFDEYVMNVVASVRDAQQVAELIAEYNTLVGLVEEMREAQRLYNETFPTGYECYAPTEIEKKVDNLIKYIREKEKNNDTGENTMGR